MEGQQPGQTISPQQTNDHRPSTTSSSVADSTAAAASEPVSTASKTTAAATPTVPWHFRDSNGVASALPEEDQPSHRSQQSPDSISWTASEYIEHSKNVGWYIGLMVAAASIAALVFILTRDKISTAVVIIAALVLGYFAARKPRVLEYRLDDAGLTIGAKSYSYELFKSFSIVDEGAIPSVCLLPMKRFMPMITLYYDQKDEDKIVDILSERLPLGERNLDVVDRFMHRIRF